MSVKPGPCYGRPHREWQLSTRIRTKVRGSSHSKWDSGKDLEDESGHGCTEMTESGSYTVHDTSGSCDSTSRGKPQSRSLAFNNLKRLCEEHLPGRYKIEVVDLVQNPKLAQGVIRSWPSRRWCGKLPDPIRRIIGDLSNTERTLVGLHVDPEFGGVTSSAPPAGDLAGLRADAVRQRRLRPVRARDRQHPGAVRSASARAGPALGHRRPRRSGRRDHARCDRGTHAREARAAPRAQTRRRPVGLRQGAAGARDPLRRRASASQRAARRRPDSPSAGPPGSRGRPDARSHDAADGGGRGHPSGDRRRRGRRVRRLRQRRRRGQRQPQPGVHAHGRGPSLPAVRGDMPDGAATVSAAGLILYANRRLCQLLASRRETIVGSSLASHVVGAVPPVLRRAGGRGFHATVELEVVDSAGLVVPVLVGASPLQVEGDRLTCLTFTDLSDQKAHEGRSSVSRRSRPPGPRRSARSTR